MPRRIDITGQRFGRLVALEYIRVESGRKEWLCQCDCGNQCTTESYSLRHGRVHSCGCYNREQTSKRSITHGMSTSPTYHSYKTMMRRCYDVDFEKYRCYGELGVRVCDRWAERNGFDNFLEDMGERPEGMSIDRIDTTGDYTPENCKWSGSLEQGRNQRKSKWWFVDGVRYDSARQAANDVGVDQGTVHRWCHGGRANCWSVRKYPEG